MCFSSEKKGLSLDSRTLAMACGMGESILVVDDEPAVRDVIARLLRRLAYDAVTASSVPEALQLIRAEPQRFSLVITDLALSHETGVDLWRALRRSGSRTPLIFMTGYQHDDGLLRGVTDGLVVAKPVSITQLAYTVRDVLDGAAATALPLSA